MRLAELVLLFFIVLDAVATISGINQYTNFWANPLQAMLGEGNPVVANIIGQGTSYSVAAFFAYLLVVFYFVRRGNAARFALFWSVATFHVLGALSWIIPGLVDQFPSVYAGFESLVTISLFAGLVLSYVFVRTNGWLDKRVL